MDDYAAWKAYWYAALYGAGPTKRMSVVDALRADNKRLRQANSRMSSAVTRNDDQRKAERAERVYFKGGN